MRLPFVVADRSPPVLLAAARRYGFGHAAEGATRSSWAVCRTGRDSPAEAGSLDRRHPLRRHRIRESLGLPSTPNGPAAATSRERPGAGGCVDPRRRFSLRLATPRP